VEDHRTHVVLRCICVPSMACAWLYAAGQLVVDTHVNPTDHEVKGRDVCVSGSQFSNATPSVRVCNCHGQASCQSHILFRVIGMAASPEPWPHGTDIMELLLSQDMWDSRRFYVHEDVSEFSDTYGSASYAMISEGMAFGSLAAGVYAGLSGYIGESGTYPLSRMHFITTSPGTGFKTTEISELHTCREVVESNDGGDGAVGVAMGDGAGDDAGDPVDSAAANETTTPPAYMPPEEVICGKETSIGPSRAKVNVYGYTWGNKWATDVEGHTYFFYRLRLCFTRLQTWYLNQMQNGEGILDTGQRVEVLDFQQEDGRTLGIWFPQFYWTGNHLDCLFADLLWELPKWDCPSDEFGAVLVTAGAAGDSCGSDGTDGVILNIGFEMRHVATKDRWFMYSMEANLTGSVSFSVAGSAWRLEPSRLLRFFACMMLLPPLTRHR